MSSNLGKVSRFSNLQLVKPARAAEIEGLEGDASTCNPQANTGEPASLPLWLWGALTLVGIGAVGGVIWIFGLILLRALS